MTLPRDSYSEVSPSYQLPHLVPVPCLGSHVGLELEALSQYSGLSVRSLRANLADPHHPLPHYRMKEPHVTVTKAGKRQTVTGKILVRW